MRVFHFDERARGLRAVLLGAALALGFAAQAGAIGIELMPIAPTVTVGDQLEIQIVATGLGDGVAPTLRAWQLDAVFDSTLVAFDSVEFSAALGDPDAMVPLSIGTLIGAPPPSGPVGMVAVSLVSDPPTLDALQQAASLPGGTSAVLATLTFDALAAGIGTVDATNAFAIGNTPDPAVANNFLGLPIDSIAPATFEIQNPIPEPSAALVFALGSGIAGLGARRRRR